MRRGILLIVIATLLVAACSTTGPSGNATQTQSSASPITVVINEKTKSEISAVLQRRQTALAGRDLQGFQSTIDMTRPALRRCQQESFDIAVRQGAASTGPLVGKVEVYAGIYVRAYVDEGLGFSRLYFKNDGNCCGRPVTLWSQPLSRDAQLMAAARTSNEHHLAHGAFLKLLEAGPLWIGAQVQ